MSRILFILSGSIACYKACEAISQLVQRGHQVRAVATPAALQFVGTATLEGLTREKVWTDLFEPGAALDHIALTRWADLTVVCPATANTLNRLAAGLADDFASALLLGREPHQPLLLAPAMNPAMWRHPATRAAIERLTGWGAHFIAPDKGRMACGEIGEGRLADPVDIVVEIERAAAPPGRRLRVLVTSGGTAEPIDGVRVISNSSTGETGALIADQLMRAGHEVLLVRAHSAVRPRGRCRESTFVAFADLEAALSTHLGAEEFDAVIHAAAVSDFSVAAIEVNGVAHLPGSGKITSSNAPLLRLSRNPKILDTLRSRSRNPRICVVAFKLTNGGTPVDILTAVQAIAVSGAADFIVHNDLTARAAAGGGFPADIWNREGEIVVRCVDRHELAKGLEGLLTGRSQPKLETQEAPA